MKLENIPIIGIWICGVDDAPRDFRIRKWTPVWTWRCLQSVFQWGLLYPKIYPIYFHTRISLVLWLWNKGIFIKLRQVTSDIYFANGCSQSIFYDEDRFAVLQRFGVQRFTSPTRRVIFRFSFTKISLITYSQIQVRLKSQFFKEGLWMCEFSRRNIVKKYAESAVFTH